jgi:hypothetical protein
VLRQQLADSTVATEGRLQGTQASCMVPFDDACCKQQQSCQFPCTQGVRCVRCLASTALLCAAAVQPLCDLLS